ncbi:MAG: glycosyltransferase family 4 protein [Thermodesulfobacteriota bacterium]|nr:glycosyltransferase family 4 protein [Thermodesulfobacteriota bacterium]
MKLAFVCGLSEKKLAQKLLPLQVLDQVDEIHLYRRLPYHGKKIQWMILPRWAQKSRVIGDLFRFFCLLMQGMHYDVIVGCHQSFHGLMACICGKVWNKPVAQIVITEVDWVYKRPLLRLAMLSADVCAVRGPISYEMLRNVGYKGRIEILHNPYTPPVINANTEIRRRRFDLVAVGNYAKEKNYPWMIQVLSAVKKEWPQLKAAIVGQGPFREKLEPALSKNNLQEHVEFLGWKDENGLSEVYQDSRAFLLTSNAEGLPMVVLEAMSHRLPVFVTDVGDLPWLVRDGEEGRVVPYGDTKGMSDALINALKNPDFLKKMGERAHARVVSFSDQYDTDKIIQTWCGLLSFVIEKRPV